MSYSLGESDLLISISISRFPNLTVKVLPAWPLLHFLSFNIVSSRCLHLSETAPANFSFLNRRAFAPGCWPEISSTRARMVLPLDALWPFSSSCRFSLLFVPPSCSSTTWSTSQTSPPGFRSSGNGQPILSFQVLRRVEVEGRVNFAIFESRPCLAAFSYSFLPSPFH